MDGSRPTRRRVLRHGGVAALAVVAGCTDSGGPENSEDTGGGDTDGVDDETTADDGTENGGDDGDTDADDGTGTDSDGSEEDGDSSGSDDSAEDDPVSTDPDDLDLREANVVGVTIEADGDTYTFDVSLHHDDDGEDGYANWWQVERLDGTRLGRRELLHAHSRQPFTRSETIDVPASVECVVVRGHDQTHGYGGLAALVDLDSGATRLIDQGTDRQSFDPSDCP